MSPKLTHREVLDRLTAGLAASRDHDGEADELELVLPGGAGREGRAVLIDDEFYLRLDVDINDPLTVIIPAVSVWLRRQRAGQASLVGAGSREAVARALVRSARTSEALAAALA